QSQLGVANEALVALWTQPNGAQLNKEKHFEVSFVNQFSLLFGRQWTLYWRSPAYNLGRAIVMLIIALVCGSCFYGMQLNTSADVLSQACMLFL
ncbi:hypothetical protein As57867_007768, partial [Aphanomyces stellatus]